MIDKNGDDTIKLKTLLHKLQKIQEQTQTKPDTQIYIGDQLYEILDIEFAGSRRWKLKIGKSQHIATEEQQKWREDCENTSPTRN